MAEREWKEYSTPSPVTADHWHDMDWRGLCGSCGMDDAPLSMNPNAKRDGFSQYAIAMSGIPEQECKYCYELRELKHHILTTPTTAQPETHPVILSLLAFAFVTLLIIMLTRGG